MNESDGWTRAIQAELIERIAPEDLPDFLGRNAGSMISDPRPFAGYMRSKFKEKEVLQQNVFLAADISENYGYKLVSEEKHTVNRDTILRLCLGAGFDLEETQEALILYGMAPLYFRLPRDIVFIVAIRNRLYDVHRVNDLLIGCGQAPMVKDTGWAIPTDPVGTEAAGT